MFSVDVGGDVGVLMSLFVADVGFVVAFVVGVRCGCCLCWLLVLVVVCPDRVMCLLLMKIMLCVLLPLFVLIVDGGAGVVAIVAVCCCSCWKSCC